MNITLLVSWGVQVDDNNDYFLPYTHYAYLEYISTLYDLVTIVSPVRRVNQVNKALACVQIKNIKVIHLPPFGSLLSAQSKIFSYIKAINKIKRETDIFYCRVPDPFCWMPALITSKPVIMHFVGDTIDATRNNEKWSQIKKWVMINLYQIEYRLILFSAHRSKVFTNGSHIKSNLENKGVNAQAVISSTISIDELRSNHLTELPKSKLTLVYVGYLRNAKGMKTILKLIKLLEEENKEYIFNIVGSGDMYADFIDLINILGIKDKIIMHGHVDDREQLNSILQSSDLFVFPSLSEGSPRVVIEAMSQGLPVVSTPVGSLPDVFIDNEDIFYFDYNNEKQIVRILDNYSHNPKLFIDARNRAYTKVKEKYTKEAFLSEIFKY